MINPNVGLQKLFDALSNVSANMNLEVLVDVEKIVPKVLKDMLCESIWMRTNTVKKIFLCRLLMLIRN